MASGQARGRSGARSCADASDGWARRPGMGLRRPLLTASRRSARWRCHGTRRPTRCAGAHDGAAGGGRPRCAVVCRGTGRPTRCAWRPTTSWQPRRVRGGPCSRAWPNAIVGTRSPEGCVGRLNEGPAGPN